MRKAVLALLAGAYLLTATTVAALYWRGAPGWAAGSAALLAVAALAFALHGLIAHAIRNASLNREMDRIRQAHRLLADQLERTQDELSSLSATLHAETENRTAELTGEVRMLSRTWSSA